MAKMGVAHGRGESHIEVEYEYRGASIVQTPDQVLVFIDGAMVQSFDGNDFEQLDAARECVLGGLS